MKKWIFSAMCSFTLGMTHAETLQEIPLKSRIRNVQPMTGIVLWDDHEKNNTTSIQLEYSYMRYSDIVSEKGVYDWSALDQKLTAIAGRKHQAIIRFYQSYPGRPTGIPAYIKALPNYRETTALSEGLPTGFPDWSNEELKRFTKEFYVRFAKRYDTDPRLAFLQTGFGLWAEYHIYDGPFSLGSTFPDKIYQAEFIQHMAAIFKSTPWSISIDAADPQISPLTENSNLLGLSFGLFDDSFLAREHPKVNEKNWNALGRNRYRQYPAGGELNYYTNRDQKFALAPDGPHGVSFEKSAKNFHITYMIGNDQPDYQNLSRIKKASMACGYKFRILSFKSMSGKSVIKIKNDGVAPIYRDAFLAVDGIRSTVSLKSLQPGKILKVNIPSGGKNPRLTIECDHLVPGQRIEFEASLRKNAF